MATSRVCGAQNPRKTWIVCLKPEGHDGKHGKADIPYRAVFWELRQASVKASG